MHVWIFNPYEPLPFEGAVRLRYASLAEALTTQGHSVVWWSADWSHGLKRRRSLPFESQSLSGEVVSCAPLQEVTSKPHPPLNHLTTQLINVPAYHKNISLRRIWSHWCYARGIVRQAGGHAAKHGNPDVIIFSVPPMEAGRVALKLGKQFGAKVVLDVMDAWPEALLLAAVGSEARRYEGMKVWAAKLMLTPYYQMMQRYCREADAICAQSQTFAEYARSFGAAGDIPVFHLAAHTPSQLPPSHPSTPSALRLVYLGSMGRIYDLRTLVESVRQLRTEGLAVELDLIGEGERRVGLEALVEAQGLSAGVRFHGFLEGEALDRIMKRGDVGIIPMHPGSGVVIPYKGPHYLSFGLYVISSLPGELMELLENNACGSFYRAGDVESLREEIRQLAMQPERVKQGRAGALRLFEKDFESDAVHADMAEWLVRG
ncbi:MAG TPA: glycosyltransferase family 4 protein [Opitutales bacterium]|nr:glycosyltransferase family 4 protein [Opitutales bacterium]